MVNARLLCLPACLPILLVPGPALAWSDLGHRIICEIAFQELETTARERVKALIRRDPEFDTFADSCSWPDHPRRRAEEHYVNLPRDAARLDADPCPLATDCVVSAIEKHLTVLSSSSETERERLESLKYLGHWVGDIHQPLHVSFQDDWGGNSIGISGTLCRWNLHAVWDSCIIEQGLPVTHSRWLGTCSTRSLTRSARPGGPPPRLTGRTRPSRSRTARRSSTASAPTPGAGIARTMTASIRGSLRRWWWSTKDRLVKAGVRLGGLLNEALGE